MRFDQFSKGDAGLTASSQQHAQKFPFCGRYLINWMSPTILQGKAPRRWPDFVKWCGSKNRAIEACTWGKGPLVEINSKMVGRANGKYKGGEFPEIVFIHGKGPSPIVAG
jgi:zincin-like metallopeptidase toxin 3 of polymorphic toxin system